MIKTILVGLGDLPYSQSATDHALELAKLHEARLTAVTLIDPASLFSGPVPIGAGESAKELREHRLESCHEIMEQAVKYFEAACRKSKVPHEVLCEEGEPFERMISLTRYHDLTICGLRNLMAHGVVGDPPNELARLVAGGVRPLLAVGHEYRKIERVLIAYSGSTESSKALKRFVQMRNWPDVKVRIVTFDRDKSRGESRLAQTAKYFEAHQIDVETDLVEQSPKDALLSYAAGWEADLIVLGNSATTYLLRRIFGETALHVLVNADLPLFLSQ